MGQKEDGVLFGYLFPKLFAPDKVHSFKVICCFFLFFVLFSGLLIHPLSDLFALGMCVWPNQYVYNLDNNSVLLALVSLVIAFLFGMVICEQLSINNLVYKKFVPLLIPTLFILPGAVEVRFL